MNQILDKNYKNNTKFEVEFSSDMFEIPYNKIKKSTNKYKIQFLISLFTAILVCFIFLFNILKNNKKEKISKTLLNNYNLTTLYSSSTSYSVQAQTEPFVIGILKIDKINLNYPILSQSNDELLKVSVCRFAGPMPNETGNLCIAGHNYIDNRFFSKLNELVFGDIIEVYDLNGNSVYYKIYNKYEVYADDLTCTNQKNISNRFLTLITCNNIDSSKRIVVQAKEQ